MALWRSVFVSICCSGASWACGDKGVPNAPSTETAIAPAAPAPTAEPTPPTAASATCAPPQYVGPGDPAGTWTEAPYSRLCTTLVERAKHDGSYGRTRVVFEVNARKAAPIVHELKGRYHALAYSHAAHSFVLGGLFESGTFMFMEALLQIDANDGSMRPSHYKLPLHIVSAVASEDGDNIALLAAPGWQRSSTPSLWLYRASADGLYGPLGPAPAPPPSDFECERAKASRWLDVMGQDGYENLDPGIITFPSSTRLRVSYGADSCRGRAQRRKTREWDLTQLKGPWIPKDKPNHSAD